MTLVFMILGQMGLDDEMKMNSAIHSLEIARSTEKTKMPLRYAGVLWEFQLGTSKIRWLKSRIR